MPPTSEEDKWKGFERYQKVNENGGRPGAKTPPRWVPELVSVEYLILQIQKNTLNINPPHQRNVVHDTDWKADIISSVFETGCIPETFWHPTPGQPYRWDNVDGKQRCSTFLEYCNNRFKWNKRLFRDLPQVLQGQILNFQLTLNKADRTLTDAQLRDTFVRFQVTKQTRLGEVWNADTCELRTRLQHYVEEDTDTLHVKGIFKKHIPDRFQLLELYGTLFAYFKVGHVGVTRGAIETIWDAHRDLSHDGAGDGDGDGTGDGTGAVTETEWEAYRQHVQDMWSIIESSPKGRGQVSTRVRPLFGALLRLQPQWRDAVVEHLSTALGEHEKTYGKIGGDHKGHLQRMNTLITSVERVFAERSPSVVGVFVGR